jgi:hypothetical protein
LSPWIFPFEFNALNHSNQYSFFIPCVLYKTQLSPLLFPYPRDASATTTSPQASTPPTGLLLPIGLVFPAGCWRAPPLRIEHAGRWAPNRGVEARSASGRAHLLDLRTLIPTLKVAVVTRCPPRTVSFKVALKVVVVMQHGAETTRRPAWSMVDERRLPQSPVVNDELMLFIIRFTLSYFYFWHIH